MTKQVIYRYLGTNGVIESPVHLEDIYYIRRLLLVASDNKKLTSDDKVFYSSITIPEGDLSLWKEVNDPGQE